MKKKWIWIGLGGVLVVLLVAGNVARQSAGKVVPVQFARVRREDITARVRAPGKIEPRTQVKVSADVMGKIVQLPVKEGDRVKKGELMLQLDDTQYRSANSQAKAARASAEARVRETESSLKVAEASYARQKALFEQHLLSQAEWDQASTNYESARAAVATAHEEVSRSQAALEGASDNLSKCRFLAPFDGVVSALNVEAGEVVITGTMNNPGTQILVVSDLSRMLVRADVDETDVVDLRIGQKAKITVDALPDTSFAGTVTEIGNTAKRTLTGGSEGQTNFEVKVVFDQDVPQVRPGMTADVEIDTGTREKTLGVPIQAWWCAPSASWSGPASTRRARRSARPRPTPWSRPKTTRSGARRRRSPGCSWCATGWRPSSRCAPASRARPRSRSSAMPRRASRSWRARTRRCASSSPTPR
jgi:HlyD family secretion protein